MTSPSTEQVSPQTLRKVIIAAGIGNFVEWFDFAVYGFLATTIAQHVRQLAMQHRSDIAEHWPKVLRRVAGPGPPASSRRAFSGLNLPPNRSAITAPPSRCTLNGDVNHQRQ